MHINNFRRVEVDKLSLSLSKFSIAFDLFSYAQFAGYNFYNPTLI